MLKSFASVRAFLKSLQLLPRIFRVQESRSAEGTQVVFLIKWQKKKKKSTYVVHYHRGFTMIRIQIISFVELGLREAIKSKRILGYPFVLHTI